MRKLLLVPVIIFILSFYCTAQTPREDGIGCWIMSSRPEEHLVTYRDGEFTFHDYNNTTKKWDDLRGKWDLKNGKLTLLYFDRSKQTFTLKRKGNKVVLSKSGGFQFTRVDPSRCK